jgi:Arc/MetJ-type ribon-helix-helix transcriptional regulator
MTTITLPADLQRWADAEVAAGKAPSVSALVAEALATVKARQDAIAAKLAGSRAQADKEGWIEGDSVLAELRAWIVEDEAEDAATP